MRWETAPLLCWPCDFGLFADTRTQNIDAHDVNSILDNSDVDSALGDVSVILLHICICITFGKLTI